jgi:hypothetical protein
MKHDVDSHSISITTIARRARQEVLRLSVCLCALAASTPGDAAATVVFTNFGAGLSYDTSRGNPVGNAFDGNTYAEASTFTSANPFVFDSLLIALSCTACPAADPFTVALSSDKSDQPGAAIESFAVLGASLGALGARNAPLVFNSLLHPMLSAGTRYWITVIADAHDSVAWNLNSTGDAADQAVSVDGGATWFSPSGNTPGAFEVLSAVPEPGTVALAGAGLAWLLVRRRHRGRSCAG